MASAGTVNNYMNKSWADTSLPLDDILKNYYIKIQDKTDNGIGISPDFSQDSEGDNQTGSDLTGQGLSGEESSGDNNQTSTEATGGQGLSGEESSGDNNQTSTQTSGESESNQNINQTIETQQQTQNNQ
ncbi:MAG: hypothetical protein QN649_08765, partial [Nitrososphaeraceae archaeon]|nr:hypothetical protein [Nitrososphaeraceae archaeon]